MMKHVRLVAAKMKERFLQSVLKAVSVLGICLLGLMVSSLMYRFPASQVSGPGPLKIGMEQHEVRFLFGEPNRVAETKKGDHDIREVWEYVNHSEDRLSARHHNGYKYFVVFHNGNVMGWDLPD
jgi:hypothetical protein